MTVRRSSSVVVVTVVIMTIAAGYVFPFYLISMNSFKGYLEVITSFLKLPKDPSFENFARAWILMKLPRPFLNTLIICVLSIGGSVLLSAMGGYKLERTGDKKSRVLYYYFIFSLVIPFFVIMIPVMIYLLGMPTGVVVGTSLFQIIFVTSTVTVLHAATNQTVDVLLALLLLAGAVVGAQFGTRVGAHLRGEQLRGLLAILVLAVCARLAYGLFTTPIDMFSIAIPLGHP